MQPDEKDSSQGGKPLSRRVIQPISRDQESISRLTAAEIIKSQLDDMLGDKKTVDKDEFAVPEPESPYKKSGDYIPEIQSSNWNEYHSAWQNYYQQYYEGYYKHHYQKAVAEKKKLPEKETKNVFSNPESTTEEVFKTDNPEVFTIKHRLLGKVRSSAKKLTANRHFGPILTALLVVLSFLLLQYNSLITASVLAYISPGSIDPQNIVISPNDTTVVGTESRLIIPKINVSVPIIFGIGNDYNSQMAAMNKGVAHFAIPGADSVPGQVGNTVLSGHSSNDWFESGDYKFIFAQLDNLDIGDVVYANYQGTRYTYSVTKKEVVKPSDVNKLVYSPTKPVLTLITCTPLGTAINRLLVTAEQINPDPDKAISAPPANNSASATNIPGNSQTLLEKLFGIK